MSSARLSMTLPVLLTLFAGAALLSWALSLLVRRHVVLRGAVEPPRADRWHRNATPTFGGIAIAGSSLALTAALLLGAPSLGELTAPLAVALAAFAMFAVGLADDSLRLTPLAKLVASLAVGAFFVFGVGVSGVLPSWVAVLAIIWFGAIVHSLNLLDNMDGLAGGVGMLGCLFGAWALAGAVGPLLVSMLLVVAGSLLGFLVWNRHPARLFMGDCGSLFVGAVLAGMSLVPLTRPDTSVVFGGFIAGLILVVPLFDTGFVLILRRMAGRRATRGGTDHVSHRLVSLGFSERSAVRILYAVGLLGGMLAVGLTRPGGGSLLSVAALFVVAVTLVGIYLARVPAYDSDDFLALQKSSFAPFLTDLAFRWHAGQVLLDLLLSSTVFYASYLIRFEGEALETFLGSFTASLPVVVACKLVALYLSGLYARSWHTFGLRDLYAVARGVGAGSVLSILAAAYFFRFELFSRGVFLIDGLLFFVAVVAARASFRLMGEVAASRSKRSRRVMIYGAGAGGQLLAREMRANPDWLLNPVGFLDDDPAKQLRWILGLPVRGGFQALEVSLSRHGVDELILSSRSINGTVENRIRNVCDHRGVQVRRLRFEIA